jgi:hypothetical protein
MKSQSDIYSESLLITKNAEYERAELKCGFLWKKGLISLSNPWKLRWMRLTKHKKLYYFKTADKVSNIDSHERIPTFGPIRGRMICNNPV